MRKAAFGKAWCLCPACKSSRSRLGSGCFWTNPLHHDVSTQKHLWPSGSLRKLFLSFPDKKATGLKAFLSFLRWINTGDAIKNWKDRGTLLKEGTRVSKESSSIFTASTKKLWCPHLQCAAEILLFAAIQPLCSHHLKCHPGKLANNKHKIIKMSRKWKMHISWILMPFLVHWLLRILKTNVSVAFCRAMEAVRAALIMVPTHSKSWNPSIPQSLTTLDDACELISAVTKMERLGPHGSWNLRCYKEGSDQNGWELGFLIKSS